MTEMRWWLHPRWWLAARRLRRKHAVLSDETLRVYCHVAWKMGSKPRQIEQGFGVR